MSNIYAGEAIAKGGADINDNMARKAEAKHRQLQANVNSEEIKRSKPLRDAAYEMKLKDAESKLEEMAAKNVRDRSYSAFDRYQTDKNPRHLNKLLDDMKNDSYGKDLYSDYVRVDTIQDTPEVRRTLSSLGIEDVDGYLANAKEVSNYVLATKPDGTQEIQDVDELYGMTDYVEHMSDKELTSLTKRNERMAQLRYGASYKEVSETERVAQAWVESDPSMALHNAYRILKSGGGANGVSKTLTERYADELQLEDPSLERIDALDKSIDELRSLTKSEREAKLKSKLGGTQYIEELGKVNKRIERSTDQVKLDEVQEAKDGLDAEFADVGGFFGADFHDPVTQYKARKYMPRIEKEFPLDAKSRATVSTVRELTGLAQTVGSELGEKEAGILDSLFNTVRKYTSNSTDTVEATSAYEQYRNVMRNALMGSAQSTQETKNFQVAVGSLKQQPGPVLEQFKVQTQGLIDQLQGVYDTNDEYVAAYRTGMNMEQLARVITQLEERIELFQAPKVEMSGDTITADKPIVTPPTDDELERMHNDESYVR